MFGETRKEESQVSVINEQERQMDDVEVGGFTLLVCFFNL